MSTVNAKSIKTKTVQAAYDLCLAHFQANPEAIAGDQSAEKHIFTLLAQILKDLNYQRVGNLDALLRTHNNSIKTSKKQRFTFETADDSALVLFTMITGEKIERGGADETSAAQGDEADEAQSRPAAPEAARASLEKGEYAITPGAEALIDPIISGATNGAVGSISKLLDAHGEVLQAQARVNAAISGYEEIIAKYKSGEETADESSLAAPDRFAPTGFADIDSSGAMVPALDNLIAQNVNPQTSFAELIAAIAHGEKEITNGLSRLKTLRSELRQVRPKTRTRVTAAPGAADAERMEEPAAGCDVVHHMAADLFPKCYGAIPQVLQFEVPKLEFDAPHPAVPEIDPTFRFNTKVLIEALHAIAQNEIIWLYGDSGCGKSEFWRQVAAHLGMPFTRMNMDGHLTRSDLTGMNRIIPCGNGQTELRFIEGILPRAMAQPGLLLIDEIDLGDPEIMPILQPVLEGNSLVLTEDSGRVVKPHPMFRIAITGNTIGLGSDNQMYLNAFEQSAATRDRISSFVHMPYLPQDMEEQVVLERFPDADPDIVTKLVSLANKVRDAYQLGKVHNLFSTRAIQFCVTRHARFAPLYPNPEDAAAAALETVIVNRLDNASSQTVKELIDQIFAA